MNPDRLTGAQRCVSTSNRNVEGRQGPEACTHLVSPVAAATAVAAASPHRPIWTEEDTAAVWALRDGGFAAVISSRFGDIFRRNFRV